MDFTTNQRVAEFPPGISHRCGSGDTNCMIGGQGTSPVFHYCNCVGISSSGLPPQLADSSCYRFRATFIAQSWGGGKSLDNSASLGVFLPCSDGGMLPGHTSDFSSVLKTHL